MTASLRGYRRTHGATDVCLPVLSGRFLQPRHGPADGSGLPDAATRAAGSYYADSRRAADAVRVCRGMSCVLSGADVGRACRDRLHHPVHCLGYCDRAPVALEPDGDLLVGAGADPLRQRPPAPPDVRCVSPVPIVTRRIARGDFSEFDRARADGAYAALARAFEQAPMTIVEWIVRSGERGRGGAAFPTGAKWRHCAGIDSDRKFIIANGDEGDSGSFVDRVLMEQDPHGVLEGLAIGAYAVGAHRAFVFIRSEYPEAQRRMARAIDDATAAGVFGPSVLGSGYALEVTAVSGLGSYVCGEETALLNAMEGLRGEVRLRPPYPTESGLFDAPTVVDNVETLVNVPWIVEYGVEAYASLGNAASSGTKALCLNRGFARPGIVEVEFGHGLREVILDCAEGGRDGRDPDAVLLGGPMGSVLRADEWDVPVCYDAMAARGVRLGHGGLVAVPEDADPRSLLVHWLRFMRDESCGRCAPCSLGSRRAVEVAESSMGDLRRLDELLAMISATSLCAFGREMPKPIRQVLAHWGDRLVESGDAAS